MFTIAWNSLTGKGSTVDTRHVYAVLKKSDMTRESLSNIWRHLAWAAKAMEKGEMPELDWRGRPHPQTRRKLFGGKHTALLIQMRGDWEFYDSVCKLPRWDAEPNMCWLCQAWC